MKHGQGKYTAKNVDEPEKIEPPIYGSFANDKLDGMATRGGETILYK